MNEEPPQSPSSSPPQALPGAASPAETAAPSLPPAAGKAIVKRGRGTFNAAMKADAPPERFDMGQRSGTSPTTPNEPSTEALCTETVREQLFRRERRKHRLLLIGSAAQLMVCQPQHYNDHVRANKFGKKSARRLDLVPMPEGPPTTGTEPLTRFQLMQLQGSLMDRRGDEDSERSAEAALMNMIKLGADAPLSSVVLAVDSFERAAEALRREVRDLLSLDDVRNQSATLRFDFGEAFLVTPHRAARMGLGELVERVRDGQAEIHMLKDTPLSTLRAVDHVTKSADAKPGSEFINVTIAIESMEKQSTLIARALWESGDSVFRLISLENVGLNLTWTCFALPPMRAAPKARAVPCCVSLRSFNTIRSRSNPAAEFVNTVLKALSRFEIERQRHRSTSYEGLFPECESFEFLVRSIEIERGQAASVPECGGLFVHASDTILLEPRSNAVTKAKHRAATRAAERAVSDHRVVQSRTCSFQWSNVEATAEVVDGVGIGLLLLGRVAEEAAKIAAQEEEFMGNAAANPVAPI